MKKRITALLLAIFMLVPLASCSEKSAVARGGEESVSGNEPDSTDVFWSDTTNITASMYTYFFNAYYKSFIERYSNYLDSMGLDTTKPLESQQFSEERTWYEYLMVLCFGEIKETMAFADAAKAEGAELSDEDLDIINAALEGYDSAAKSAGLKVDDYIADLFGDKVNRVTVEKCLRVQRLAAIHYLKVSDEEEMTDEDCEKFFEENKNSFLYYDCYKIVVPEADSEALLACTSEEEFVAAMRLIITNNNFNGNYEKYSASIEELLSKKRRTRNAYDENSTAAVWAFDESRQPYEIYSEPAREGDVAVYMLLPTNEAGRYTDVLYRDMEPVRSVIYALFDDEDEAQRVYDEWKNGDSNNKDGFLKLAEEHNGDTAVNIERGDYDASLNDWIFSNDVKTGDSTVVTMSGAGTYLLYMLEPGDASWLVNARQNIGSKNMSDIADELMEKYPATYSADIYKTELKID